MTKAEKDHLDRVASIGCIVCRIFFGVKSAAHIHHLSGIKYRSVGKKATNFNVVPLCPAHHQHGTSRTPSVHTHPKLFAEMYGTQEELLDMTNKMLEAAR